MAHRLITQVVITGARVFGRAFTEAYKQANAASKYQGANGGSGSNALSAKSGLTLEEACKILNISPPRQGKVDAEHLMERFKKLYDMNDPQKGGSFYLQSKVLRARERLEAEALQSAEKKEAEEAVNWNPKMYKDR